MMPRRTLVSIVEGQAWRLLGISCLGLVGGALLVVVGLVTGFLAIIGLILFVVGCIGVPMAIVRLINPMGHESISRLGRTPPERQYMLGVVESELSMPETWHARTTQGGEVFLTSHWLVFFDSTNMTIAHRNDVLWLWQAVKKKRWSSSQCIRMHTRYTTSPAEFEMGPMDYWLLPALTQAFPHALFGFDPRWQATPRPYLAAEVDRRRAAGF
jgi:hypothetical protein